jgi:hypothetical protein
MNQQYANRLNNRLTAVEKQLEKMRMELTHALTTVDRLGARDRDQADDQDDEDIVLDQQLGELPPQAPPAPPTAPGKPKREKPTPAVSA